MSDRWHELMNDEGDGVVGDRYRLMGRLNVYELTIKRILSTNDLEVAKQRIRDLQDAGSGYWSYYVEERVEEGNTFKNVIVVHVGDKL